MKSFNFYNSVLKNQSEGEINTGMRDFLQRSSILINWLKKYTKSKNPKILECGCGVGLYSKFLLDQGYKNIIGIDINTKSLKFAEKFMKVKKIDCEKMDFPEKTFDVIIALNIIEHLHSPDKFLRKIKRILKKDGICVLSTPNTTLLRGIFGKNPIHPSHLQYWNYSKFVKILKANEFILLDSKPIGRIPFLSQCNTFMVLCKPI
jgi:2-polyprenyl-3-methyl-5-hydroxy-6-metoxy-1,4-benzoquinol methylase